VRETLLLLPLLLLRSSSSDTKQLQSSMALDADAMALSPSLCAPALHGIGITVQS
jgi:hypothetical protein